MLAIVPLRYQLSEEAPLADDPQNTVERICSDIGIPCLDLTDAFRGAAGTDLFLDSRHPTAAGHEMISRALLKWEPLALALKGR
jgi:hypothetical protein